MISTHADHPAKQDITEGDGTFAPCGSFVQALRLWHGDILELTFSTGYTHAGIVELSGDDETAYVTGRWTHTTSGWKLFDPEGQSVYRVANVIGVRHMRDQSKEL